MSSVIKYDFFYQGHVYVFLKTLKDNSFHLLYKLNQSISLIYKYIERILLCSFFRYKIFFQLLAIFYYK